MFVGLIWRGFQGFIGCAVMKEKKLNPSIYFLDILEWKEQKGASEGDQFFLKKSPLQEKSCNHHLQVAIRVLEPFMLH